MQPEYNQAIQNTESENPSACPSTPAQHGSHHISGPIPSGLSLETLGDDSSPPDPTAVLDINGVGHADHSQSGANFSRIESRSPAHRISDYEDSPSGSRSTKTHGHAGYDVTPSRNMSLDGPSIEDFPNGTANAI